VAAISSSPSGESAAAVRRFADRAQEEGLLDVAYAAAASVAPSGRLARSI